MQSDVTNHPFQNQLEETMEDCDSETKQNNVSFTTNMSLQLQLEV